MRRGFTLIEMLAVMTVASVIFTVLGTSIFALHRTQSRVQSDAHTAATLAELARRLRMDAHAATTVSSEGDNAVVLESEGDRRIVYDFDSGRNWIQRRVMEDDEVVHRDAFVLPRGAEVVWTTPGEGEPPLVAVVIARPQGRQKAAEHLPRRTRIEAVVGLDQRFSDEETSP
jgi:prepilin-type N-terminal cleavage/methylation domain-containing protein